ncbi:MAG: LptF/LptG family permease [Planctomycetes bacterium]|nr:LptF/LptG family permease [Planctomycetota bacterium]
MKRRAALGGKLDRYVGGIFASSYLTALLVVLGLFFIMDMAENLDDFLEPWPDGSRVASSVVMRYYLANTPFLFLQAAPFITLIAGLFTLTRLLRNNEVEAAMAAGISARRLLVPIFFGGALAALGMVVVRESATTTFQPVRESLLYVLKQKSYDVRYEALWMRTPDGSLLRMGEYRPGDATRPAEGRDLAAHLREDGKWVATVRADRATWAVRDGVGGLVLEGGERVEVGDRREVTPQAWLGPDDFAFTPELALTFLRARHDPLQLSYVEARELGARDPDNVQYQTLTQYHLTFPLANLVLLAVGLPLLMRHERGRGAEGLAKGLLLCLFFFAADFVCRNLGVQGALDPLLASWLPVLFFGSLGVALYETLPT